MSKSLPEYLRELADWIHHEAFHKLPDELEEKADEVRELAQTLEAGVVVVPVEIAEIAMQACDIQAEECQQRGESGADYEHAAGVLFGRCSDALSRLQQHGGEGR